MGWAGDWHSDGNRTFSRPFASIWREIRASWIGAEIDRFLTAAEGLGFSHRVRLATGSQVPIRLLIQTGRRIEELTGEDLDEPVTACRQRQQRTGKGHTHYLAAVANTHRVLFHLGVLDQPPQGNGPVPLAERFTGVPQPLKSEMIAYLQRKKATCQVKTVSATATRLKTFGQFLASIDPELLSVGDLDRRRHIEPWLASLPETLNVKDSQPISIGDRNRRVVTVSTFLTDITEWDWDIAPARKVIFRDDIPKLPHLLPRYLPVDADRRLTASLTQQPSNEMAALALRLQRACGLRIGELLDLELDCVHQLETNGSCLIHATVGQPSSCSPITAAAWHRTPSAPNSTTPPRSPDWVMSPRISCATPTPPPWSTPVFPCRH